MTPFGDSCHRAPVNLRSSPDNQIMYVSFKQISQIDPNFASALVKEHGPRIIDSPDVDLHAVSALDNGIARLEKCRSTLRDSAIEAKSKRLTVGMLATGMFATVGGIGAALLTGGPLLGAAIGTAVGLGVMAVHDRAKET